MGDRPQAVHPSIEHGDPTKRRPAGRSADDHSVTADRHAGPKSAFGSGFGDFTNALSSVWAQKPSRQTPLLSSQGDPSGSGVDTQTPSMRSQVATEHSLVAPAAHSTSVSQNGDICRYRRDHHRSRRHHRRRCNLPGSGVKEIHPRIIPARPLTSGRLLPSKRREFAHLPVRYAGSHNSHIGAQWLSSEMRSFAPCAGACRNRWLREARVGASRHPVSGPRWALRRRSALRLPQRQLPRHPPPRLQPLRSPPLRLLPARPSADAPRGRAPARRKTKGMQATPKAP